MIDRALAHGAGDSTTSSNMLSKVMEGEHNLWVIHESGDIIAGIVVSIRRTSAKTSAFVELAAGRDMDRWIEKIEGLLKDYQELAGADTIEASCRAGLARRLSKRGWRRKAVLMELK